MKSLLIILCLGFLSPMFAQTTIVTGERQEPVTHKAAKGYPPHGYPCLGCALPAREIPPSFAILIIQNQQAHL